MGEIQVLITILAFVAVILMMFLAGCRFLGLWHWIAAWIWSTREEKVGLTRLSGHYNANGYLVHSDSDIHLDATGSFKRFDPVDRDFRVTMATTNIGNWDCSPPPSSPPGIPPQPLRPAPVPPISAFRLQAHQPSSTSNNSTGSTDKQANNEACINQLESISPTIKQFTVTATPPPSPATPFITQPKTTTSTFTMPSSDPITVMGILQQRRTSTESTTTSIHHLEDGHSDQLPPAIKRAMSCDSVCSDTSVNLGDLEEPNITGYLCIGLEYDNECCDLAVSILEAKDLIGPQPDNPPMDTYVKVYLSPDKTSNMQTRVYRYSNSPSYKERFLFAMMPRDSVRSSVLVHVYCIDRLAHTLVGEAELKLADVALRQPVTTWVTLTDTGQRGTEFGELMFSLSYLPTAERLTVVVVKARNLKFSNEKDVGDPFVKVYLLRNGKKVHKKKTATKKGERFPIFNEAMIFSVPAHTLQMIQLRLTVADSSKISGEGQRAFSIGHVIVGAQASGRALSHWNQMLAALRKPVAMWHPLRK